MVNPFTHFWNYWERSGVRRDLPVLKRMFVEIPHMPLGAAVAVCSTISLTIYVNYFYDIGYGYRNKYTVLRPDDPTIPKYRKGIISDDQIVNH